MCPRYTYTAHPSRQRVNKHEPFLVRVNIGCITLRRPRAPNFLRAVTHARSNSVDIRARARVCAASISEYQRLVEEIGEKRGPRIYIVYVLSAVMRRWLAERHTRCPGFTELRQIETDRNESFPDLAAA